MAKTNLVKAILDEWNKRVPFLTHRTEQGKELLSKFLARIYHTGMTNLGQSKRELEIQKLADKIYEAEYGIKCPYRVFLTAGYTDHLYQAIHIMGFDSAGPQDIDTLCHELAHIDKPSQPHGKRFAKKVAKLVKRAEEILVDIS